MCSFGCFPVKTTCFLAYLISIGWEIMLSHVHLPERVKVGRGELVVQLYCRVLFNNAVNCDLYCGLPQPFLHISMVLAHLCILGSLFGDPLHFCVLCRMQTTLTRLCCTLHCTISAARLKILYCVPIPPTPTPRLLQCALF